MTVWWTDRKREDCASPTWPSFSPPQLGEAPRKVASPFVAHVDSLHRAYPSIYLYSLFVRYDTLSLLNLNFSKWIHGKTFIFFLFYIIWEKKKKKDRLLLRWVGGRSGGRLAKRRAFDDDSLIKATLSEFARRARQLWNVCRNSRACCSVTMIPLALHDEFCYLV